MMHDIVVKLLMLVSTHVCKRIAHALTPLFRALQNMLFPFEIGCVVSMHEHLYSIVQQRGVGFKREYKLVDIKGVNPILLPQLPINPNLIKGRAIVWYRGGNLRKVSHPKLNIELNLTQRIYGLG
jgi:hypothetical protein